MSKKERFFWIFAYTLTAILTLLPFLQVGITNSDDFQYFNTAHTSFSHWVDDAKVYAQGAGRFYFLITKYFYNIPYIIDSFVWTKFVQYLSLFACYFLSAYLIYKIFKSQRLGALVLLLLIFNMSVGLDWFYVPTAYPFYFTFSFVIFLLGVLLYVNYTEKHGTWRILLSAVLFFVTYLFYENYLVFTVIFCLCVLIKHWKKLGLVEMLKSKQFYLELAPYVAVAVLYMIVYVGYRHYVLRTTGADGFYDGTVISSHFDLGNFFTILYRYTIYTLPGRVYALHKADVAANSLLITGHYDNIWYVITHASAVSYINALLQCGILWALISKTRFKDMSWTAIILGFVIALAFAFSSQILIAISGKYNWDWIANVIWCYVPTFFSYFGIMIAIALMVLAILKLCQKEKFAIVISALWCILLVVFSLINSYTNESLAREWRKSQNRITVLELMAEDHFFDNIPEKSIIYTESLHKTSRIGSFVCNGMIDMEILISRLSGKQYLFSQTWEDLRAKAEICPNHQIYIIQATESKKYGELLIAFSHITSMDGDLSKIVADKTDIVYYSPTKDYVLFYNNKAVNVISNDKHKKITHVSLEEEGMNPLGFSISNLVIPTTDTIYLP